MKQIGPAALRLIVAAALAWCVAVAVAAPELPRLTAIAAVLVGAVAVWRPAHALIAVAALTPAGLLLASSPARGPDLIAWAFLAGWFVRIWRPLAEAGWPARVALPAALYGGCAAASWFSVMFSGAAGVDAGALPAYLGQSLSPVFLVFSIPENETWAMVQAVTGVALLFAAASLARAYPALRSQVAWAIAGSMAVLGVITALDVWRQWADAGYVIDFLLRYTRGERFARHLEDVNAAGSQYVLAAGIAVGFVAGHGVRRFAVPLLLLAAMAPAFWLTGSRSAFVGMAGAIAAALLVRRRPHVQVTRAQIAAAAVAIVAAIIAAGAVAAFGSDEQGSAGRALRLRTQFTETSVRMIASEPVYGVGVGRYFVRSPEFMPSSLRELYGAENAHNYFAQQFAELGIVGGALFLWLVAAVLAAGWRQTREPGAPVVGALLAGVTGYTLTCVTGHPFLVSAAALPFWIAAGTVAAADAGVPHARRTTVATAITVVLAANVAAGLLAYQRAASAPTPPERGLDRADVADDGRRFRWSSPHAVTYVPSGAGFLRVTLRAPDIEFERPMMAETAVAGRVVDRRSLMRGEWVTFEIPVRAEATAPFRRVDLRVVPYWTEKRPLGQRSAPVDIALGAMVGELRWVRPQSR